MQTLDRKDAKPAANSRRLMQTDKAISLLDEVWGCFAAACKVSPRE
jgi:hypothetical protein